GAEQEYHRGCTGTLVDSGGRGNRFVVTAAECVLRVTRRGVDANPYNYVSPESYGYTYFSWPINGIDVFFDAAPYGRGRAIGEFVTGTSVAPGTWITADRWTTVDVYIGRDRWNEPMYNRIGVIRLSSEAPVAAVPMAAGVGAPTSSRWVGYGVTGF